MLRRTLIVGSLILLGIALPAAADPTGHVRDAPPPSTRAANRTAARAWASKLISELRLPASAASSPGEPAGVGTALDAPGFSLTTPELIDDTSWWTIQEPGSAVIAFVRAHLPHALRIVGRGVGGERGQVNDSFWSYSPPTGLSQLSVAVQTDALAGGQTAVRLDAEATWLLPRPAWDRIPDSVRSVTYTARATVAGFDGGQASHGRRSAPRRSARVTPGASPQRSTACSASSPACRSPARSTRCSRGSPCGSAAVAGSRSRSPSTPPRAARRSRCPWADGAARSSTTWWHPG
jgi:hypothetical protein